LFGVAGRNPAQYSTLSAAPSAGNSRVSRCTIAAQRTSLIEVS
jgi:hypothetical protein